MLWLNLFGLKIFVQNLEYLFLCHIFICEMACLLHLKHILGCVGADVARCLIELGHLECTARDVVTPGMWQSCAEDLWPTARTLLPGNPKFQVRALRALPSKVQMPLQHIDPDSLSPCQEANLVLLALCYNAVPLCRCTSTITLNRPEYNFHGHAIEEEAAFILPDHAALTLENEVVSWWQSAGRVWPPPSHEPVGLEEFENIDNFGITVWLEIWFPGNPGRHHRVLRPDLRIGSIWWEDMSHYDGSSVTVVEFTQLFHAMPETLPLIPFPWNRPDVGYDFGGSTTLRISLMRPQLSKVGRQGPLEASVRLQGSVDEHQSFLMSGYLSKLHAITDRKECI